MKRIKCLLMGMMVIAMVIFSACDTSNSGLGEIKVSQRANGSSGSYWKYELSTEDVLNKINYEESRALINLGPGYKQMWTFEVKSAGEVTFNWLAYEGNFYVESSSYSETYVFDDKGHYYIKQ